MGAPCKLTTTYLLRRLSDEQRAILLSAGDGDLTVGFNECLSLWAAIHPLKGHYVQPQSVNNQRVKRKQRE